jgi:outer membrane protein assembly factor BamB
MLPLATTLALSFTSGCGLVSREGTTQSLVSELLSRGPLWIRWRRPLVRHPILTWKPQEFSTGVVDGDRFFVGTSDHKVRALRVRDGATAWEATVGGAVSSRLLVDRERGFVLVGAEDGVLYAFDRYSGTLRWSHASSGPVMQAPAVRGGTVFVTNADDKLIALNADTGKWLWQYERDAPEGFTLHGHAGVSVAEGRVFTGFADGHVVALDARTGDVAWSRKLAGDAERFLDIQSTPVVGPGNLLFASSFAAGVYALDRRDGAVRWRFSVEGAGELLLVGVGPDAAARLFFTAPTFGVTCLDLEGKVRWRQALPNTGAPSAPVAFALGNGRPVVAFSLSDDGLYAADAEDGALVAHFNPGKGISGAPAVGRGELFVLANGGTLFAMSVR